MEFLKTWMYNPSFRKIGFEDVKYAMKNPNDHILINTLSLNFQDNIIQGTLPAIMEESVLNKLIEDYETGRIKVVVYGKNNVDESAEKKAKQLLSLGFSEVYLYCGGMFEWLLLQEIYGYSEFPTTFIAGKGKSVDLLKYSPEKQFQILRLGY
jgi:hypothetical protein